MVVISQSSKIDNWNVMSATAHDLPNKVYEITQSQKTSRNVQESHMLKLPLRIKPQTKWSSHGKLQQLSTIRNFSLHHSQRSTLRFLRGILGLLGISPNDITSRTTGFISWLWPKVVLCIYCAVVEILNCWVVECTSDRASEGEDGTTDEFTNVSALVC